MMYFLRFWSIWDEKRYISWGFNWFGVPSGSIQSFRSITFHYQIDALGSISELTAPRRPPELSNHYFSLSNRCLVNHFGAEAPELPNHYFSLSNWCPRSHFEAQGAQKHQSFQTISFHYQIDALQAISELKADPDPLLGACRRRLGPKTN